MKWRTTNAILLIRRQGKCLSVEQGQLFEETIAADIVAMIEELAQLSEAKSKEQAKHKPLSPEQPCTDSL
jgi:hypothetical protein